MTTPGNVLAVNPGARGCGVAYFRRGLLAWAELARSPSAGRDAAAWVAMATAVLTLLRNRDPAVLVDGDLDFALAIETQQVYERGKGDQNDLILLASVGGAVAMTFQGCPELRSYLPSEWKGQVPKPKKRSEPYIVAERCSKRLSEAELAGVVLPDDVERQWHTWDAVGLGLHVLGRWYR